MGKYLKKFELTQDYEGYIANDPFLPNVSFCRDLQAVHFNPVTPPMPVVEGLDLRSIGVQTAPEITIISIPNWGETIDPK